MADGELPKYQGNSDKAEVSRAWPGAFEIYSRVFKAIQANYQPLLLVLGVNLVLALLSLSLKGYKVGSGVVKVDLTGLSYLIFLLALPRYGLALARGKQMSVGDFMKFDGKKYTNLFFASIVVVAIWLVSALAFIIPLIWTIAWFLLFNFPIVDKDEGVMGGLRTAKALAQNNKSKVWAVIGVSILISIVFGILNLIPVIGRVAQVFVSVWAIGAEAVLYDWLRKHHAATE